MQSWGDGSQFCNRTTLPFPTRSGILGLLCCAGGRGGEQREWLQHMAQFKQTIHAYAVERGKSADPYIAPQLHDFQMVGSGYDTDDPWQNLLVPKKIDGKKPTGPGTKLLHRYYLQDMAFACILEIASDDVDDIIKSLQKPVWTISLGRRNCPPSDKIYQGIYVKEDEAFEEAKKIAKGKKRREIFSVYDGVYEDGDEIFTINDVPIQFGIYKKYYSRQVTMYKK